MAGQYHLKSIVIVLLLLSQSYMLYAQMMPVQNVQSPDAASLGQYGNVPVSLYTGVPQIEIPLYTLKTGNYSMPISLTYHIQNVKCNSLDGQVGRGWSLQAGGQITRTVRGTLDERTNSSGRGIGCFYRKEEMKNVIENHDNFKDYTNNNFVNGDNFFELTTDEYSFNFCGYVGNFYIASSGGWVVVSDDDIKVTDVQFIDRSTLKNRFSKYQGFERLNDNTNCFIDGFTLVTPDGCKYVFGGSDATEYCTSYYDRLQSMFIPSAWKLKKIITVDNHQIVFSYKRETLCNIEFLPEKIVVNENGVEKSNIEHKGYAGFNGFLLFPVVINKIKVNNRIISFKNIRDVRFNKAIERSVPIYWNIETEKRNSCYYPEVLNANEQFTYFLPDKIDINESSTNQRKQIANSFVDYQLDGIIVMDSIGFASNDTIKKISFEYNRACRRLLKSISSNQAKYSFFYNDKNLNNRIYFYEKSDSWGYLSGGLYKISDTQSFGNVASNLDSTKVGTLSSIIYPTGGKTSFEYELNTYGKYVDDSHLSLHEISNSKAGGLRLKSLTDYDYDGQLLSKKNYFYSQTKGGKSSGVLKNSPKNQITYNLYSGDIHMTLSLSSIGGFFNQVTNLNTPDVGYSYVIEETTDNNGNFIGSKRYRYSNYDDGLLEEAPLLSMTSGSSVFFPFSSHSLKRGKLLSEETFDNNGALKKKTEYRYKEVCSGSFLTGNQMMVYARYNSNGININNYAPVGWLTKTYTYSYFPENVITTEYTLSDSMKVEQSFDYNDHRLLITESMSNSQLSQQINYTYPKKGDVLYEAHILKPYTSKSTFVNGTAVEREENIFNMINGVPYIQLNKKVFPSTQSTIINYEVTKVDKYGNPTEYVKDGIPHVILWYDFGRKIAAILDNISMERLKILFPNIENTSDLKNNDNNYITLFDNLLEYLSTYPNIKGVFYTYEKDNVSTVTTLDKQIIEYDYDIYGRLKDVFRYNLIDLDFQLLKSYKYHYHGVE